MITTDKLGKTFRRGGKSAMALADVSVRMPHGAVTAIIGESGAGKTTFGRIIAGLEKADTGTIDSGGLALDRTSVIFQGSRLLTRRTALANVALPLELSGVRKREREEQAREMLARVGLSHKEDFYPSELSGGQCQRVGIARALISDPEVLVSDEATSGLDPETTKSILALLRKMNDQLGITVVLITHEMDVVREIADHVIAFADGRVVEEGSIHDLIGNPASIIGRRILPLPDIVGVDGVNRTTLAVTYMSRNTSPDWYFRLARDLGCSVDLLGATVQDVDGETTGRVMLGLDDADVPAVTAWLESDGLSAEQWDGRQAGQGATA